MNVVIQTKRIGTPVVPKGRQKDVSEMYHSPIWRHSEHIHMHFSRPLARVPICCFVFIPRLGHSTLLGHIVNLYAPLCGLCQWLVTLRRRTAGALRYSLFCQHFGFGQWLVTLCLPISGPLYPSSHSCYLHDLGAPNFN